MAETKSYDSNPNSANKQEIQRKIMAAARAHDVSTVQALVDEHPDLDTQSHMGAFHRTVFKAGLDVYRVVFEKYPHLKHHGFHHDGCPVSDAIRYDNLEMLRFLISKGFDIMESYGIWGPVRRILITPFSRPSLAANVRQPLYQAREQAERTGNMDIVKLLEEHGAKADTDWHPWPSSSCSWHTAG
jgi:hypothetical protein